MKRLSPVLGVVAASLGLLAAGSAQAFVLADTCGHLEPGCPILHWETDGDPIPFRLQHDGSRDISFWSFETQVRVAFDTWAQVPTADVDFLEGGLFMGEARYQDIDVEELDRESVLFFVEEGWAPRAPEVIALTSITFGEGGKILDADIGFNADDWFFTVGDELVQVDFLSIAVHEVGHYLGLDHSEDEAATMHASYDEGDTSLRSLTDDDRGGVAALYPCADVPCVGDVGPGCSTLGEAGPRGLLAALCGLVFLGLSFGGRRRRAGRSAALLGGLILLLPLPTTGSVVEALDVDRLGARADVVLRATVAEVTPYLAGAVRSEIVLDVSESWKGLAPGVVVLDQPGGLLPDIGTVVFGMPRFEAGEDVVVYLRWPEGGEPQVLGLAQGKFVVDDDGSVHRDLAGLSLARVSGAAARTKDLPGGVDELRLRVAD